MHYIIRATLFMIFREISIAYEVEKLEGNENDKR